MLRAVSKSNLIVLVLLLAALCSCLRAAWVLSATQQRGEWQATKGFLEARQAPRTTEYPGVTAWLQQLMRSQCAAEPSADAQTDCVNVLRPGTIPTRLRPLQQFLTLSAPRAQSALLLEAKQAGRLCIAELELNQHRYVATRPALDSNCEAPAAGPPVQRAIALLDSRPAPGHMTVEPFGTMEPIRAYVVAQDGAVISRRFADRQLEPSQRGAEYQEFARAAENLALPAVAAVNSFFPLIKNNGYTYTGTYADVTGLGVVATGMTQTALPGLGVVVLAIDVALGIDWIEKIALTQPRLLPLDIPMERKSGASWAWVVAQASARGMNELARLAQQCSGPNREFDMVAACTLGEGPEDGLLAATLIGVSNTHPRVARWLIAWMPPLRTSFALAQYLPAALLSLAGMAYAFRNHQFRAVSMRAAAQSRQWTRLIDSIGAAVIIIDPNTDRVRFRNTSAQQLGIETNQVFRELVAAEDRRLYDEFNLAAGNAERAYAVRLQSTLHAAQWAIVRSTACVTSLPMVGARESDRLGVMAPLRPQELERLRTSLELSVIQEERGKLSSLITHGVTHLTRMLASERTMTDSVRGWLSAHLARRVGVLADLLSGWALPLDEVRRDELAIAKQSIHSLLESLQRLATEVAGNRSLRRTLHWSNGVLSRVSDALPFRFDLESWPDDLHLTTRIEGAEAFIFDELLINAFKHGKPGCPPVLTARVIRWTERRWIEFEIRNEVRSVHSARVAGSDHRYGGQTLVQETCRRLRWELLPPQLQGATYIVKWRARAIEAAEAQL